MKRTNLYRFFLCFVLGATIGFLPAAVMAEKPIELKYVTAYQMHRDHSIGTRLFVKLLEKLAGDRIKLVYKGGPEAIPPFELGEAVRKGVVDFAENAGGYYAAQVPEANAWRLSRLHPWELRVNGGYELYRKVAAERANIYYLGWTAAGTSFHIYTRKKVQKTADFRGMKIRSTPTYAAFVQAMGAVPIQMTHAEIYTAMERGVVDGVCSPQFGVFEKGWQTKVKYTVFPQFYQVDNQIIFNYDTWKRLPKDVQKIIDDVMVLVERDSSKFMRKVVKKQHEDMRKIGVKEITVSDAQHFTELAYESAWKDVLAKSDPKYGPQLKKLMSKCLGDFTAR